VDIRIPLYRDERTPEFDPALREAYSLDGEGVQLEPDTDIHMDCMAFGMGMCCLQVTFQARDCDESRYMYDQLAVLAPIMLAMTAATPVLKGRLSGNDVRWSVIAQSVDDRTAAELGEVEGSGIAALRDPSMAGEGVRRIDKSRYGSISTYIYHCPGHKPKKRSFELFNDIPCEIDEDIKDVLLAEGIDVNLAYHIAHLFIRDPLVVFSDSIEVDDAATTEHFESIQSTNWQTCRWKPPPPRVDEKAPHIGWRTEFRPMEVQLTDFENAAFTVFTILITRVILAFDLALYIPLSKVRLTQFHCFPCLVLFWLMMSF
jgi:glutamate--cysteine ligase catalytic subunit